MKSFKSPLSMLFAFGIVLSASNAASAQGLDSGSIRMGSNGPVGSLSTPAGSINVSTSGANTTAGSFGFSIPGGSASTVSSGAVGPQGQQVGGFANAVGSFGSVYNSQGATGAQYHTSPRTNTNYQGGTGNTRKQNTSIYENSKNTNLSQFSVDPSSVHSGSFSYGFRGTRSGGIVQSILGLPTTSTGSFDGNTVSP